MKLKRRLFIKAMSLSVFAIIFLLCSEAFAMEKGFIGGKIWNNIMLWINFGILVFFFNKFGKKPLMDFLYGERKKIEESIDTVDGNLKEARSLMEAEAVKLESMDERLNDMKKQILELGEMEKQEIIKKAKDAAVKMIEDAKIESEYRLAAAKNTFSEELLDMAITMSIEKLEQRISSKEDETIIDGFTEGIGEFKSDFI